MEILVSISSSASGYIKESFDASPKTFPQLKLVTLRNAYDRHLRYLNQQVHINRMDTDTVKDLRATIAEIKDRREQVNTMVQLNSIETNGVPKLQERLHKDRERAWTLYRSFVQHYPKG